jgi:hypothetical protein
VVEPELKARGIELHELLVQGRIDAPQLIAKEILPQVMEELKRRKSAKRCDEDMLYDSIYDAFFEYVDAPRHFNANRLSLVGFLGMAAYRNLLNAKRDAKTRSKYEKSVELSLSAGKLLSEGEIEMDEQDSRLEVISGESLVDKVASLLPDPTDQKLCLLMLHGERKTAEFAKIAGLATDDKGTAREIKRHKDRIKKVLERSEIRLTHGKRPDQDAE